VFGDQFRVEWRQLAMPIHDLWFALVHMPSRVRA
jgi:hypothetical protein